MDDDEPVDSVRDKLMQVNGLALLVYQKKIFFRQVLIEICAQFMIVMHAIRVQRFGTQIGFLDGFNGDGNRFRRFEASEQQNSVQIPLRCSLYIAHIAFRNTNCHTAVFLAYLLKY